MNHRFHPEAEDELFDAVEYYERIEPGLGLDLAAEIDALLELVASYPQAWPTVDGDIRRAPTKRFPYSVLYSVEPGHILVVAVMHLRREPRYWEHRVQEPQPETGLYSKAYRPSKREGLRRRAADELFQAADKMASAKVPSMTMDEIQAEVNAARAQRRRSS